jgi:hypothetical protein
VQYQRTKISGKEEREKKLKYKSFCTEIHRMRNMTLMIIPVKTEVTVIVTKGLKRNLEAMPGTHSIDSLQKTAVVGT